MQSFSFVELFFTLCSPSQFDFPSVSHFLSFLSVLFLHLPCVSFQMSSYPPPFYVLVEPLERIFLVSRDGMRARTSCLLHHKALPICLLTLLHFLWMLLLLLIAILDSQTTGITPMIPQSSPPPLFRYNRHWRSCNVAQVVTDIIN